jgi:hypothetical protein
LLGRLEHEKIAPRRRDDAIARERQRRAAPGRIVEGFDDLVGSARAGDARDDGSEGEFVVARVTPEAFARLIERVAAGDVEPVAEAPTGGARGRPMPRRRGGRPRA